MPSVAVDKSLLCDCDRICHPAETWQRVEALLPQFGITRLSRLTGLDKVGIPVWNAVSPNAKSIVINQGKGVSDLDARVSAAMEALERAVAGSPAVLTIETSPRELLTAGERVMTLPELIASGQYDIGIDDVIVWIKGKDLIAKQTVWIPLHAVTLDRTLENCRFWQSSDGLASGNDETEAILHGLLERVERDADALWRLRSMSARLATCIDPACLGDPVIDGLTEKYARAGLILRVFDLTSEIAVPCYSAVAAEADILNRRLPRFHDVTIGYGAHPVPRRAVLRALTEVAQSRLTYISGARDDIFAETYERPLSTDTQKLFEARPVPPASQALSGKAGNPESLLKTLLSRLEEAGIMTVIAVPLQSPGLPVSVIKIIVPDLESPDGARKRRLGARALSLAVSAA
jgi:YcaO-like protein with predicted kinase domain